MRLTPLTRNIAIALAALACWMLIRRDVLALLGEFTDQTRRWGRYEWLALIAIVLLLARANSRKTP